MSTAVEVGARSTRKGARLHPSNGCRWSFLPLVGKLVELTTVNAHRTCRSAACRKAVRTAIDTARAVNDKRCATNHTVKIAKDATEGRLNALAQMFRSAAEVARHAELLARVAPVVVEEVQPEPQLSDFGRAAQRIGFVPQRAKRPVTTKSQKRRLALANSFAHAA